MMSQSKPETERPMIVFVNGQETQVSTDTLHDLLLILGFAERPVAVEVNQEVIPRALADRVLREQDKIEVVLARWWWLRQNKRNKRYGRTAGNITPADKVKPVLK